MKEKAYKTPKGLIGIKRKNSVKQFFEATAVQDICAAAMIALIAACLLWRVFRSFNVPDESFYVAFIHRYLKGDGLVGDEWHVAQFMAFVEYLPARLYTLIRGSTDGIILFFRILYVAFQTATSTVIYLLLRKRCFYMTLFIIALNSLSISIILLSSLSYYLLSTNFLLLSCLLLTVSEKKSFPVCFACGVLLALSVTCYSFNAIIFFVYAVLFAVRFLSHGKRLSGCAALLEAKTFVGVLSGVVVTAVAFLVFLFAQTGFQELVSNFKYLFIDPEHISLLKNFAENILYVAKNVKLLPVYAVAAIAILADKKREQHTAFYIAVLTAAMLADIAIILSASGDFTRVIYISYVGAFFSICVMLLLREYTTYASNALAVSSSIMCVCTWYASNQGYFAATAGINLCTVACVMVISNRIKAKDAKKGASKKRQYVFRNRFVAPVFIAMAVLVCAQASWLYFGTMNWENCEKASQLNAKIESGPFEGVYTTAQRKATYDSIISDLDFIKENYEGQILVPDCFPWIYLYVDRQYGTFSPWMLRESLAEDERMPIYYSINAEHIPEIIYVPKVDRFTFLPKDTTVLTEKLDGIFEYETIKETDTALILKAEAFISD